MTDSSSEITPDVSKRICSHMNEDHAPTVHAMVQSTLSASEARCCKVQNAKMKSVGMEEYTLSYILCDGDACQMKKVSIPFEPPLKSADEVRPRLIEEHHKYLSPKWSWLITDPIMRMLFGACILLGVGTSLGRDELSARIDDTPWASTIVDTVFGSSTLFAKLVIGAWYFSVAVHGLEAVYVAFLCKTTLKMTAGTTAQWFALNMCTGFPIMNKIRELVDVDKAAREKKKQG